jgi:hypothetical protein
MLVPGLMILFLNMNKPEIEKVNYKLVFSFGASILLVLHAGSVSSFSLTLLKPNKDKDKIQALIDKIPPQASVCAHGHLGYKLSNRKEIDNFPLDTMNQDYILIELSPFMKYWTSIPSKRETFVLHAIKLLEHGYKIVGNTEYVFLLNKSSDTTKKVADIRLVKSLHLQPHELNTTTGKSEFVGTSAETLTFRMINNERKAVFFGPYLGILAGNYNLKIKYLFEGEKGAIAHLRIVDSGNGIEYDHLSAPIETTSSPKLIIKKFTLPKDALIFESPLDFEGKGKFQILDYRLEAL